MLTANCSVDTPYDLPCEDHSSTAHVITGSLRVQRLGYILIPYTPAYLYIDLWFYQSESHAMPRLAYSVYAHFTLVMS